MQSSLGNLCPLYIIAGDGECLRDEIVYLAHKAAHPKDYPTRRGVLKEGRRQKENAEKFQTPTKVIRTFVFIAIVRLTEMFARFIFRCLMVCRDH